MAEIRITVPEQLPVYPMHEQVIFPYMVFPLFVAAADMPLVDEALRGDHLLAITSCFTNDPPCRWTELARIGTLCRINRIFRFPDGGCKVVVEGIHRIRLRECRQESPYLIGRCEGVIETGQGGLVAEALVQSVNALLKIALPTAGPCPGTC